MATSLRRPIAPPWTARPRLLLALPLSLLLGSACGSGSPPTAANTDPPITYDLSCLPQPSPDMATAPPVPKGDLLPPTRLLRRASLVLRNRPASDEELASLEAAGDAIAQRAFVDAFIDRSLADPAFYQTMFELARDWLNVPLAPPTADSPEYGPEQQRSITRCKMGTPKAGLWHYFRETDDACDGKKADGTPVDEVTIEPWWAPGSMATLIGEAANTTNKGIGRQEGNPIPIDCNGRPEGTCGCGPHAIGCHADFQFYPGWEQFVHWNELGQRRQLAEEPARLFAHIAWHDRPASDLVTGTYSVGAVNLQAAYVMQGLEGGALGLLNDDSWWQPAKYAAAPVDPLHTNNDPNAWREFAQSDRNPFLLADRAYHFDPRSEVGPMKGIPAAGMLTSLGFLDALPRERLRAARALENLACEVLAPPAGVAFNPYVRDPYNEGPCQHCHKRIDPAAIHFKRWGKAGSAFEGWGAEYLMPGIGPKWHWPKPWRTGAYPYHGDPFAHWNRWYVHDTGMVPVSQAAIDANPEVVFLDFLPPEQTLLGQHGDGTVGPLGFGKMIVAAGAFDRCVVRHVHQQILGRDLDPTREAGYLDALTAAFTSNGRKIRPLVKSLTQSDLFRRGR